ncbi:MAG: hypothetical protein JWP44_4387 [Mucilaginibacter sp.]|nr:hypothetical protein [Mucilaginibacter sp.]
MSLTSVWEGDDASFLSAAIPFYTGREAFELSILDATANTGKIWKGTGVKPDTMDSDPRYASNYICDNREMPGVPDGSYDLLVYDPPHFGNSGREKSNKGFDVRFGCGVTTSKAENYTMSFLYPGFLASAMRVLRREGLVMAKITDQVHNHRSRWAHVDFIKMAESAGFLVCDLIVKVRKGPMMSSKWQNLHHARKRHTFWIILRNSLSCERTVQQPRPQPGRYSCPVHGPIPHGSRCLSCDRKSVPPPVAVEGQT